MIRVSGSTLDLKPSFLDNLKSQDTMNDFFDVIKMHSALGGGDNHSSWSDTEHRIFFLNRYLDMLKAAAREREFQYSELKFDLSILLRRPRGSSGRYTNAGVHEKRKV